MGAALQYKMLVRRGLEGPTVAAALTAVNVATFAVVLALPVLALPTFLAGAVDPDLMNAALVSLGVFTLLTGFGAVLMSSDPILGSVGRLLQRVRNFIRRGSPPLAGLPARLRPRARSGKSDARKAVEAGSRGNSRAVGVRVRDPPRGTGRGGGVPAARPGAARVLRRAAARSDSGHARWTRICRGWADRDPRACGRGGGGRGPRDLHLQALHLLATPSGWGWPRSGCISATQPGGEPARYIGYSSSPAASRASLGSK